MEHALILGSVEGPLGNKVTLRGCHLSQLKRGSFKGVRQEYRAQRGFFGRT